MALLIYFIFLYFMFKFRGIASPGLLLLSIYLFSVLCGLLIGQDYEINSLFGLFNLLFLAGILTALILPWNKFNYKISIAEPNPKTLRRWTILLLFVNGIAFCVFISIFYQAYTVVTNIEKFKNSGGAAVFIEGLNINHSIILFAMYFHTTAYFLIPIHLHYLVKGKYFLSILSFLLSLNIGLFGLTVFSRSGIIEYLLLYFFYLPYFYDSIKSNIGKLLNSKLLITMILIITTAFGYLFTMFYKITENRFENAVVNSDSLISNPQVYSLFNYASQWLSNSIEVMSIYSFETLKGELSFPLARVIANKLQIIDYPEGTIETKLYSIWGEYHNAFNGLISNLLFDLGYLGTLGFVLFYMIILKIYKPVNGKITFDTLLIIGVVYIIPAMGIFNYQMKSNVFNALIVFCIIMSTTMYMRKCAIRLTKLK